MNRDILMMNKNMDGIGWLNRVKKLYSTLFVDYQPFPMGNNRWMMRVGVKVVEYQIQGDNLAVEVLLMSMLKY